VVEWRDATLIDGSMKIEDCLEKEMPIYKTFGVLIKKDKTTTRLASEILKNGIRFRELNLIPTGSIISITSLKEENNG